MQQNKDNQEQEVRRIDEFVAIRNEKSRDRQNKGYWVHANPEYEVESFDLVLPSHLVIFGWDAGVNDDTVS